jgi:hypothetical protein
VVQTNSEFGYALGIAVIGSLGTLVYRSEIAGHLPPDLPAGAANAARESLTGAITAAAELPGISVPAFSPPPAPPSAAPCTPSPPWPASSRRPWPCSSAPDCGAYCHSTEPKQRTPNPHQQP